MTDPRRLGRIVAGQVAYQLRLYARGPRAVLSAVLTPLALLVLLAAIGDSRGEPGYHGRLTAAMTTMGLASVCYTTLAAALVAGRDAGVLKRLRATPLPLWAHLTGRVAATLAVAVAQAGLVVVVGVAAYGARIDLGGLAPALAGLVLGGIAISLVGLAVAQLIPRGDAAATLLSTTLLPVVLVSGVFFPASELPGWVAAVAGWLPLSHVGTLLGAGFGGAWSGADVAWLGGWAVAGLAFTLLRFRAEPAPVRARRWARPRAAV
jgi:ABC-2 type transport system permease protein